MIIKSLFLKNFRQFKGERNLNFSCEKQRNVTVVLGDNTSGKTTLLQAFTWCLYGNADFETKDFLLNLEVANDMNVGTTETVEITIVLIHNNVEYNITRSQEYICDAKGVRPTPIKPPKVSYKKDDGQTEPIKQNNAGKIISKILPEDLSNYFFFDTERIGNISSKKEVTEAVQGLLGLSVLDNAMKHIKDYAKNNLISKLKNSMDLNGNQKAMEARERMQSEQARREVISEQMRNINSEIIHYEKRKEQLEEIIRENQPTALLQTKKENLECSIKSEDNALENACEKFISDFNTNTTNFFAQPLMQKALELLKGAQIDDKGIKNMTAQSIADIIRRKKCVCGTIIEEGNEAYNMLLQTLEFLPPQSLGTIIGNFKEMIVTLNSTNNSYYSRLASWYEDIHRYKTRIREWEDEITEISEKIKDKENMRKYEEEINDVKKRLKDFNEKKERLLREDGVCVNDIERYQKVYDSLIAVSEKNRQINIYIKYAEEIYKWIEKTYREKESVIREKLETKVNSIFAMMYHGRRKVVIDDKYRVSLLTTYADDDVKTDESKGLETVKNFAFVAGLVELAKEKIQAKDDDEIMILSSEPYPLVMDAPFSNADEKHVSNISKVLPQIAEQVIMFVMEKDWKFAENVINQRVGKKYFLDKKSETLTYIKEGEQ